MKKRLFAGLLAVCMTVNLMSATAFATEQQDVDTQGILSETEPVENAEQNVLTVANDEMVYVAKINDNEPGYETLQDAFSAAQDGDKVIILKAGTYELSTSGKNITITGAVDGVVFADIGAKNMGGADVTFNNVTFDYYPNVNYTGLQHSGNLVYNDCTFNGQVFLYGNSETFVNCTFNQNSADAYNVWTYGAEDVEFDGCTLNSAGKSVLIYKEGDDLEFVAEVSVTNTKLIASAPVDGKAAIEMDSSLIAGINLTIDGETTAAGFGTGSVSGNSLWNNKKGNEGANSDITVIVDGETVLKAAVTGLKGSGSEEDPYLINDIDELKWFRDDVNTFRQDGTSQYSGKFIKLTADIDLDEDGDGIGEEWEPIGSTTADHGSFYGTFDGDGHTISNLVISEHGTGSGFFAQTSGGGDGPRATVKNITFHNIDIDTGITNGHAGSYAGGVIANAGGNTVVENVHVTGDVYVVGYGYVGGIIGHGYPKIDNCSVKANESSYINCYYWSVGGILGYGGEGNGATKITNSEVSNLDIWGASGGAATICGNARSGAIGENLKASNCTVSGNDYALGYIFGNNGDNLKNVEIVNVTISGEPCDAVATVGDKVYLNLHDAVNAGGEVKVLRDAVLEDSLMAPTGKTVKLNLNEKTISAASDLKNKPVIRVLGDLTVTNGTVDGTTGINSYAIIVGNTETAGKLTIINGTYKGITTAVQVTNGVANISGGTFATGHDGEGTDYGTQYLLNCMDAAYKNGTAKFDVTGGTFVGFNPANNAAEGVATNYTAAGTHVIADNGNYIVHVIKAVAEVSATCTGKGTKAHYKCDTCGKLYSDAAGTTVITDVTAPAKGHKYSTKSDSSSHWSQCSRCGDVKDKAGHSYTAGKCSCGYETKVEVYVPETTTPAPTAPTPTTTPSTATQPTTTQPTTTTTPSTEETTTEQPAETPVEEIVVDTKIVEEVATEEVKAVVKETVTVAEVKEVEKTTETGTVTVTEVKVAVTTETVDKVIENTEAGATIILPLTEVAEEGQAVTEAEVAVEALEKVVEAEAALTVEFEGVKVTFEPETIKAIAEQAQGSVIELRVVPVEHHELNEEQQAILEEHDVAVRVSAQIFSDGEYIGDFKGGKARIAIPFTPEEGKAIEHHKVYFVDDNGEMTLMPSTYVDGHMVLETTHFSDYVIVYEEVADAEEAETIVEDAEAEEVVVEEVQEEAGLPIVPIIIVVVAVILVVAFIATRKKNDEE